MTDLSVQPASTDLARAIAALKAKRPIQDRYFAYYDGPVRNPAFTEALRKIAEKFDIVINENWSALAVDAVTERIDLTGFVVANSRAQTELDTAFSGLKLALLADDAHEACEIAGESYVIVWPDADETTLDVYYNDPRSTHLFYNPLRPAVKEFAAKWWTDDSGICYLNLYYPNRIEHYETREKITGEIKASAFVRSEVPVTPNPWNEVPVWHLRTSGRYITSILEDIIPIQDKINLTDFNSLIAAEFAALPQKYIISETGNGEYVSAPNAILDIPAGSGVGQGTSAGQFLPGDIGQFIKMIDRYAGVVAMHAALPKHYLLSTGGDPSGEALIAAEAALVRRAKNRIKRHKTEWQDIARFLLKVVSADVPASAITPLFALPETVQPLMASIVVQNHVTAGVPLVTALRWAGRSDAEIDQMLEDKAAEATEQQAMLAKAQLDALRQFNADPAGDAPTNDGPQVNEGTDNAAAA